MAWNSFVPFLSFLSTSVVIIQWSPGALTNGDKKLQSEKPLELIDKISLFMSKTQPAGKFLDIKGMNITQTIVDGKGCADVAGFVIWGEDHQ